MQDSSHLQETILNVSILCYMCSHDWIGAGDFLQDLRLPCPKSVQLVLEVIENASLNSVNASAVGKCLGSLRISSLGRRAEEWKVQGHGIAGNA